MYPLGQLSETAHSLRLDTILKRKPMLMQVIPFLASLFNVVFLGKRCLLTFFRLLSLLWHFNTNEHFDTQLIIECPYISFMLFPSFLPFLF